MRASAGLSAGLTLTERVAALRRAQSLPPPGETDRDRAARRLLDWRSQPPFATGPYFAQRLAAEGITEDELLAVLGEPIEAGDGPPSPPPPWMEELERALAGPAPPMARRSPSRRPCGSTRRPGSSSRSSRSWHGRASACARASGRWPRAGATCRSTPPRSRRSCSAICRRRCCWMLDRTLVLELHVARLQGLLPGDTPEERFQSFLRHLRRPQVVRALFHEYPGPGPTTDHRPGELRQFLALLPREAVCRLGGDPGGLQPRR